MIAKERKTPLYLLKLQALARRLPPDHPKYSAIQEEILKRTAGYKGELAADYQLTYADHKNLTILHDLRLPIQSRYFQIDSLVLTPCFVLILEIKNIAGTIHFDPAFNQFVRTKDGVETAFADPILQADRLEKHFGDWLETNKFTKLPILDLVVISNPRTIIKTVSSYEHVLKKTVIHAGKLLSVVTEIQKTYKKRILTDKDLKRMVKTLNKQHTENNQPIMDRFEIKKSDIISGVFCQECGRKTERIHGNWFCRLCKSKSKTAHLNAIDDYGLLIDSVISNKAAREFLGIPSSAGATRLLQSLNLKPSGKNKGRTYELRLIEYAHKKQP
ncbi:NERD domain-containing protein [Bacillus mangrovi]|uniref:NERD domain-containing protein n=1 Tax=Metabacillus mangrovi TaxID=1491830 RepID=A0A7X2S638_9BACI|nr:nuclease-related domain-containing protein [Metabacillus mangrovi]MTH54349.1 NERD domain-containing protein [Metabacillus mangrovi]